MGYAYMLLFIFLVCLILGLTESVDAEPVDTECLLQMLFVSFRIRVDAM